MLALLPESHDIHSPNHAPEFRDWKPVKIQITRQEWAEAINELVSRLIEDAGSDAQRWEALLPRAIDVAPADRKRVRERLATLIAEKKLAQEGRESLWGAIRQLVARHREYSETDWALPAEEVDALEQLASNLSPASAVERHSWIFEEHMPDLGTGAKRKDGEYDHAGFTEALAAARREAVEEVLSAEGWDGIMALVERSEVPWAIGSSLAEVAGIEQDANAIAQLTNPDAKRAEFAAGFCRKRFAVAGWDWINAILDGDSADEAQSAILLLASSDYPAAWERADELGDRVADEFWRRFSPLGLGPDYPHVSENAKRLLGIGRPAAALELLGLYGIREGEENDASLVPLVVEALEGLLDPGPEDGGRDLRQHELDRIFEYLETHRETVGEQTLGRLEWSYLQALGMEPRVPTLEAALATDPAFFVEVISAVYRARSEDETEESLERRQVSQNAYRLLSTWREVPGLDRHSGEIDSEVLRTWVDEARQRLQEVDRLESGEVQIGKMLAAAPPADDGIKPPPPVRDLLENVNSERIEEGLRVEIHNSRGITSRDPEAGGEQERELAQGYEEAARQLRTKWPRTASILRDLAKSYEAQAHNHDERAERLRKGLER